VSDDLTGTTWRCDIEDGQHRVIESRGEDRWLVSNHAGDGGVYELEGEYLRTLTRVPDAAPPEVEQPRPSCDELVAAVTAVWEPIKALFTKVYTQADMVLVPGEPEPADEKPDLPLAESEVELLTGVQKDPSPADCSDRDLLTGTLYGNPFTDWPVRRFSEEDGGSLYFPLGYNVFLHDHGQNKWLADVTVTSRKPAPTPPLATLAPWQEPHAAPLWRHKTGAVHRAATLRAWGTEPPAEWQGGYFISADLIEKLPSDPENEPHLLLAYAVQAILDAADAR